MFPKRRQSESELLFVQIRNLDREKKARVCVPVREKLFKRRFLICITGHKDATYQNGVAPPQFTQDWLKTVVLRAVTGMPSRRGTKKGVYIDARALRKR